MKEHFQGEQPEKDGDWGWTVSEQVEEEDLAEGTEKGKAGGGDRSTGT